MYKIKYGWHYCSRCGSGNVILMWQLPVYSTIQFPPTLHNIYVPMSLADTIPIWNSSSRRCYVFNGGPGNVLTDDVFSFFRWFVFVWGLGTNYAWLPKRQQYTFIATSGSLRSRHPQRVWRPERRQYVFVFRGDVYVACTSQCRLRSLRENPLWSIDGVYVRESPASLSIAMAISR